MSEIIVSQERIVIMTKTKINILVEGVKFTGPGTRRIEAEMDPIIMEGMNRFA